jgi:hypothetical protein
VSFSFVCLLVKVGILPILGDFPNNGRVVSG